MQDSTGVPTAKPFDPRALPLRTYRRKSKQTGQVTESLYMDVRERLVWLRETMPTAKITTNLEEIDLEHAVFSAHVDLPNGGSADGWGSETKIDFTDYIEKAETKALGRALAACGFGAQFALEYRNATDETVDASTGEITGPQRETPQDAPESPPAVPERGLDETADPLDLERLIALWTQEAGQALSALEKLCRDRYDRDLLALSVQQCAALTAKLSAQLAQRAKPKP